MPESERGFEKSSCCVSLVVIIVAAILGTIQEVNYRQAADGALGSTHREPKQGLNGTRRGRAVHLRGHLTSLPLPRWSCFQCFLSVCRQD